MQIGDFFLWNYLSHELCHATNRECLAVVDYLNYLITAAAFDLRKWLF